MGDERLQKRYCDTLPFSARDSSFIISGIRSNVEDKEESVCNKQHTHRSFSQKSSPPIISQLGLDGGLRHVLDIHTAASHKFYLPSCSLWRATKFNLDSGAVP
jgi:hypothetical protein